MFWMSDGYLDSIVEEDLHLADLTSLALDLRSSRGRVEAAPKEAGVVAGVEAAVRMFRRAGADSAEVLVGDGAVAGAGEAVLAAEGTADRLHAVYKAAQNFMEYSSGIAGRCKLMVDRAKLASPRVEVLLTRKHLPGAKRLSLSAALAGGASIHRTGLSDSILFFDQHRVFAGGVPGLAERLPELRRRFPEKRLCAEVATVDEAEVLVRAGLESVQCERFPEPELRRAVAVLKAMDPRVVVLAAGGVDADNAGALAATGVDGLVTSWPYFGEPFDVRMTFREL